MTFFSMITKEREYGLMSPEAQLRVAHFPEILARKLKLEKVLMGHALCVNRLAWNAQGSRLLSGSDDRRVLIWQYPDYDVLPIALSTRHEGNIFAVRFLPCTGDRYIVSGAMDNTVQLHHLDVDPTSQRYSSKSSRENASNIEQGGYNSTPETINVDPVTTVYTCHRSRVKDIDVEPMNPHNFWSASEDGTVRQFDTRWRGDSSSNMDNVLISVHEENGAHVEIKGVSINEVRPHQVAIACGDPYIRIYDRRKLSPGSGTGVTSEPILLLAPPHLTLCPQGQRYTTNVHFGNRGDKVVATYHGDHAYSFDVTGEGVMGSAFIQPNLKVARTPDGPGTSVSVQSHRQPASDSGGGGSSVHDPSAKNYILQAKKEMASKNYKDAVRFYDKALYYSPHSWDLYIQRALALLKRNFAGDACFALRDCHQAILLKDDYSDAHFVRLKALKAMGQLSAAKTLLGQFLVKFPDSDSWECVQDFQQKLVDALMEEGEAKAVSERRARERKKRVCLPTSAFEHGADEVMSSSDSYSSQFEDRNCHGMGKELSGEEGSDSSVQKLWAGSPGGQRLLSRFIGHCNVQTDVKESIFVGQNDDLVACASDDGNVFIYEAATGRAVQVLDASENVTNCVQCHPSRTLLATSGLDPVINIWSPTEELPQKKNLDSYIMRNQERMRAGVPNFFSFSPIFNEQMQTQMQLILDNYELVQLLSGQRDGGTDYDEANDTGSAGCRVT